MSSVVCDKKAKILATDTHRQYADNEDFYLGDPPRQKHHAFQAKAFLRPSASVERAKRAGG